MNFLDRAIEAVAPVAALKRASARAALDQVRAYEGARKGRRERGWPADEGSANAHIQASLSDLRTRSRQMVRDTDEGKAVIETLTADLIGTGILARHGAQQYTKKWDAWCESCDATGRSNFYGLQQLAASTVLEAGEIITEFVEEPFIDPEMVPLKLRMLEPDFLDDGKNETFAGGGAIVMGVEVNALGREIALHIFDQNQTDNNVGSTTSRRRDARDFARCFRVQRVGQLRGVPSLHASLKRLRNISDFEDAHLARKIIESCIVGHVVTSDPARALGDLQSEASSGSGGGPRHERMAAGTITYGGPGESIAFNDPTPSTGVEQYMASQLARIAAANGSSYAAISGDYSRANYSSERANRTDVQPRWEQFRWNTFIPQFLAPIYLRWVTVGFASNRLRTKNFAVEWSTPRRPFIDPEKDASASKTAVESNQITWSEDQRQRGYDPDRVLSEMADERNKAKAMGIILGPTEALPPPVIEDEISDDAPNDDESDTEAEAEEAAKEQAQRQADRESARALTSAAIASLSRDPVQHIINVATPDVKIDAPITVSPSNITVERTEVHAPVTVTPAPVHIDHHTHIERPKVDMHFDSSPDGTITGARVE